MGCGRRAYLVWIGGPALLFAAAALPVAIGLPPFGWRSAANGRPAAGAALPLTAFRPAWPRLPAAAAHASG